MSNEIKKEPATTGSLTPQPKKRGRKPSKKQYFTSDVDVAIQEYLASSNQAERNEIYRTRIAYAFYKLAENLIHTFKFYYTEVESLEDFISKQSEAINACDQRLKQLDNKNVFYADDQIGFFFKEVQKIQEALNEFTLK